MYKTRKVFVKIWEKIDSHEILLLNGPRQVGKTSLLKMIQERLIAEKKVNSDNIYFFDLEKATDLDIFSSQSSVLALLPDSKKEKYYIFIDEFQKSKKIGSILKVLHDHYPQYKIIITGSASWYLDIDESLAGRKIVFSIWPLSFSEYIEWKNDKDLSTYYKLALKNIKETPLEIINTINKFYLDFATFGGYPAVVLAKSEDDKKNILAELLNSYLTWDIQIYNYKANTLQIKAILTMLASQVGSLLNIGNLSINVGIGRTAIQNRLELLQNTFILHLNSPYFVNKIKELSKNPKVFLVDSGLRNMLLENFSIKPKTKDFGYLIENVIVTELYKQSKITDGIYFWRTVRGQEVDIIRKRENNLLPIEVKSGNEDTKPDGLKSFIKQYKPDLAYVLNWSIVKDEMLEDTKILFRPLWYLE